MTEEEGKQALTEEQRDEVIRACEGTIKYAADYNELDVLMARVALAALTAQPDDWQHRAEAAEAERDRRIADYKHLIEQHMPRTSDGCDKGWSRVIDARELQDKLKAAEAKLDQMCDSQYIAGLQAGFVLGDRGDNVALMRAIDAYRRQIIESKKSAPTVSLAELVPDGWRLVPAEPTPEMLEEIWLDERFKELAMKRRYQAMLAAAPTPPQ